MTPLPVTPRHIPIDIPIDVDADPARELARRELSRSVYADAQPSLLQRAISWIGDRVDDLLQAVGDVSPGGTGGVVVLLLVVVLVVVAVRWRLGRTRRAAVRHATGLDVVVRTADEHRRVADEAVAGGRFDEAVRERMRALVRGLEERALLDVRPGRTAGEAANEIAAVLPPVAEGVREAARRFDETVYGGRPADAAAADRMRAVDDEVRRTRPVAVA